ncbi:hypothetical protein AnigIFM60653_004123 [Aspergillus niger]|nr:hypothetical protein AnigIFM60653_004123 [Aspergillus niger]
MADLSSKAPRNDEFTVGWICALAIELAASEGMLDEIYPARNQPEGDDNVYTLGRIGQHNIVIACLPAGSTGITPAAKGAADMLRSFPSIRFGLMVGIGGGAPSSASKSPDEEDIRLGDVVVSVPDGELGGVIKYDRGKMVAGGQFEHTGMLNMPPAQLRNGVNKLRATYEAQRNGLSRHVTDMIEKTLALREGSNPRFGDLYSHQGWEYDQLFEVSYEHQESAVQSSLLSSNSRSHIVIAVLGISLFASWGAIAFNSSSGMLASASLFSAAVALLVFLVGAAAALMSDGHTVRKSGSSHHKQQPCPYCDTSRLVRRRPRTTTDPVIHHGTIASADMVMRHAATRERLRRQYRILCFEMEAAGLMNDFPCLVIRGICDYSDTHKHKIWQRYAAATAAAYAKDLLSVIPPAEVMKMEVAAELVETEQERKMRHRILSWLAPSAQQAEQVDAFSKHRPGTGQWFLHSEQFSLWLDGKQQTLFCPGIPGAGKTILASIVIDHLQREISRETPVAYLYCSYDQRQIQTASNRLSIVLRQILEQLSGPVPASVRSLYEQHEARSSKPTMKDLSNTLLRVVMELDRAFLVVDALDECSEETCRELLDQVRSLQSSGKLSFMVTSRPSLEYAFDGAIRLDIRAQGADIECYLDSRWSELSRSVQQDEILKLKITQQIINLVDGMFLLATLHFDSLKDKRTKNEFHRALDALPHGSGALKEAYDNAMERINRQRVNNREWAQRIISWVIHAVRPLRRDELRHALAIEKGDRRLEEDNFPDLDELISLCAGLVIHNQEADTVQLVHYTTYDYLTDIAWALAARDAIATSCVTYLLFETFGTGSCASREELQRRLENNSLYTYASVNWAHHVRTSSLEENDLVFEFLGNEDYVSASGQALMYTLLHGYDVGQLPRKLTGMHLAAYFGLERAMLVLLAKRVYDTNPIDSYGQTPLLWAVQGGQQAAVELLLKQGADLNLLTGATGNNLTPVWLINGYITTGFNMPLAVAVQMKNSALVELLLNNQADPNLDPCGSATPLWWAAREGYLEIANTLLQHGADPNLAPPGGGSPLWWAVSDGNIDIARLLLEHKANPNPAPPGGGSPLWVAVRDGNRDIARLLLEHRADPNLAPPDGGSPLWLAVREENIDIARLLLAHKADPNSAPPDGGSPLFCAARDQNSELVGLLLEHKASPFFDPVTFHTPSFLSRMGVEIIYNLDDEGGESAEG